jgi:hypothetical protein
MAYQNGMVAAAPFSNEIIQVLHMGCDGEGAAATAALKGLEYMPVLTQFSSEWRNVAGRCRSAVQRYHRLRPDPVLTHDKVGHAICRCLANVPLQPRRLIIAPAAVGCKRMLASMTTFFPRLLFHVLKGN